MTHKESRLPGKKKKNLGKLIAGLAIMTAALASAAPPEPEEDPCGPHPYNPDQLEMGCGPD